MLPAHERLAGEPFLAVAEIAGGAASARILAAAAIDPEEIEAVAGERIEAGEEVTFDRAARALRARAVRRLGAVVLGERPLPVPPTEESARALARGVADLGLGHLPWSKALAQWRERVAFLRRSEGGEWPDLSDDALLASVEDWLAPHLIGKTSLDGIDAHDLGEALHALLPWPLRRRLDAEAPTHLAAPTGSQVPVDYGDADGPVLAVRVQELFGLDRHPTVAGGRVPLVLHLLSPAGRPIQITRDLPGFWRGSWASVRADMRGRYPKHPWPVLVAVCALVAAATATAAPGCPATTTDGFGPFGRGSPPVRVSIGKGHVLSGVVLSALNCKPIRGARVELWQANANGRYTRASSGTVLTDGGGRFRFEGPFPATYGGGPAHIHMRVVARAHEVLLTRYEPARGARRGSVRLVLLPQAV